MSADSEKTKILSDHALEMVMRDVMDGLLELSLESAHSDYKESFEIIEIAPIRARANRSHQEPLEHEGEADILEFTPLKRAMG